MSKIKRLEGIGRAKKDKSSIDIPLKLNTDEKEAKEQIAEFLVKLGQEVVNLRQEVSVLKSYVVMKTKNAYIG